MYTSPLVFVSHQKGHNIFAIIEEGCQPSQDAAINHFNFILRPLLTPLTPAIKGPHDPRLRHKRLWRHDEIIRIRHLEAEIADMQKEIDRQKQEAVAANERPERTKKGQGIID